MAKMIKLTQGTPEWLAWRRGGITATEAACIYGVSKWGTRLSVYKEKLEPKPHEQSKYEEWGTLLEPVIRNKFAAAHPEYSVTHGECYEDDWKRCSLDGECRDKDGNFAAILEIKTGSNLSSWDPVPDGYFAQVQWQMHVTGIHTTHFAVLVNGHDYFERTVKYEPEYAAELEAACKEVWDCIQQGTPPEPDGTGCAIDVDQELLNNEAMNCTDKTPEYELSDEEYAAFMILKEKLEDLEHKFKAQKLIFTKYLTKAQYLTYKGARVGRMVSMAARETIDSKKLKDNYPEVYEACKKIGRPTVYPKFG